MKSKTKILFLSFATISLLPLFSLSCKKRQIEILNPFSDPQRRNLINELVNLYNKENPQNYKAVVKQYADLRKLYLQLSLDLENKEKNISNLLFHYPSAAYLISKYKRSLNFYNEIKNSDLLNQFLSSNKWLSKINKQNGQYILPFASGTESLVINKLTLGYVLYSLQKFQETYQNDKDKNLENKIKNKTIISNENADKLKSFIEYYKNQDAKTKNEVNKIWKLLNDNENNITSIINDKIFSSSNFNYDDSIFNYYEKIFNFSLTISKLIGNDKLQSFQNKNMKHIFYNKGISTLTTLLGFNKANGNYDNYFLKYKGHNLNYSELFTNGSESYNKLKEIFEYQANLIKNNVLHYNKSQHNQNYVNNYGIFSQWSSRQLAFLKKTNNYRDLDIIQTPTKLNESQTNETFFDEGVNLIGIKKSKKEDAETKKFVYWAYNKKYTWTFNINNKKFNLNLTPTEYFALKLNYAFPSRNFIEQYKMVANDLDSATIKSYVNIMRKISLGQDLKMFHEPVDDKSDTFRMTWENIMKNYLYNRGRNEMFNYDQIIKKLKEVII